MENASAWPGGGTPRISYPATLTKNQNDEAKVKAGLAASGGSAKSWTDEELQWLLREMETMAKLKEYDNRKLLWLAMNTKPWRSLDVVGIESEIFAEIENRLYPEYDGETVTFEEWGWRTPEGDIRYLPNDELKNAGPRTPDVRES